MKQRITNELIYEFGLYFLGLFLIVYFFRQNSLLFFLLLVIIILANRLWHKEHDYIFFIIGAILGPFAEIIAIHYGVWSYANPTFLGIPIWLPLVWGFVLVTIVRVAETFVKIEKK
tara:strand:+ start:54 stop:401 length:348 start_codon:yes stop_codon:yes gene_type:complete